MKSLIPIFLIIVSIAAFLLYINPTYGEVTTLREQQTAYNAALGNSKKLQAVRDTLVAKYNGLPKADLDRLHKLLPDNVDNIRLIIEVQQIAAKYGMTLKDVKFQTIEKDTKQTVGAQFASDAQTADTARPYGIFPLEFSTEGTYANFLLFLNDVEHSLRLVDLNGISFSSVASPTNSNVYTFSIKINTYWLKN